MHPTAGTTVFIYIRGSGRRVIPGVRRFAFRTPMTDLERHLNQLTALMKTWGVPSSWSRVLFVEDASITRGHPSLIPRKALYPPDGYAAAFDSHLGAGAATAITNFENDLANQYNTLEATEPILKSAAALTSKYKLRAYDAVQLAVALEINKQLLALGMPAAVLSVSSIRSRPGACTARAAGRHPARWRPACAYRESS